MRRWGMKKIHSRSVSEKKKNVCHEAWNKLPAINVWKECITLPSWTKTNPLLPIYSDPAPCHQYQVCETICQSLSLPYACTWKKKNSYYPLHVQQCNPLRLIFYIPQFICFYNIYKKCHCKAWKKCSVWKRKMCINELRTHFCPHLVSENNATPPPNPPLPICSNHPTSIKCLKQNVTPSSYHAHAKKINSPQASKNIHTPKIKLFSKGK